MKENKQAALVALLGLAATGAVVYATRKWWMPKVKETVSKYHYADEEETIEIPALTPRVQIADDVKVDTETLEALEQKVCELFKAVVQKTKGECLINPLIVCTSRYEAPHIDIPQTEEVEEHLDTVIAEGERIFAHTAEYHGTKLVF